MQRGYLLVEAGYGVTTKTLVSQEPTTDRKGGAGSMGGGGGEYSTSGGAGYRVVSWHGKYLGYLVVVAAD